MNETEVLPGSTVCEFNGGKAPQIMNAARKRRELAITKDRTLPEIARHCLRRHCLVFQRQRNRRFSRALVLGCIPPKRRARFMENTHKMAAKTTGTGFAPVLGGSF